MALGNIINFKKYKTDVNQQNSMLPPVGGMSEGSANNSITNMQNNGLDIANPMNTQPKPITTPVTDTSALPMARGQVAAKTTARIDNTPVDWDTAAIKPANAAGTTTTGGGVITQESIDASNVAMQKAKEATDAINAPTETLAPPKGTVNTTSTFDNFGKPVLPPARPGSQFEDLLDQEILNTAKGEGTEVTAARQRLDREKTLRVDQAQRSAHEQAVRAGYTPGTAQYDAMMRGAMDTANRANIEAENKLNEFARETRQGNLSDLASAGQRDYLRSQEDEGKADADFNQLLSNAPSEAARTKLLLEKNKGTPAGDFMASMFDANGTLNPEFRDLTANARAKEAFVDSLSRVSVDPVTGETWDAPDTTKGKEQRSKYGEKTWSQMMGQQYTPITEQGTMDKAKREAQTRIAEFMKTGDVTKVDAKDWEHITPEQKIEAMKGKNPKIRKVTGLDAATLRTLTNYPNDVNKDRLKQGDVVELNGQLYTFDGLTVAGDYNQDLKFRSVDGTTTERISIPA